MGVVYLKRLIQEAKSVNDVITLEATVITGFEGQAVDECKAKCKPLNCCRAKGRIFFNIKKDSYPNVLKLRSIDNVFLVSEAFEDLKFTKVKEEDLLKVKNLVDLVEWKRSVPQWAEIVGFKGVQFPKCAQNETSNEDEPVCQSCLKTRSGGGGDPPQSSDGGSSKVEPVENDCEQRILISDEEVFHPVTNEVAIQKPNSALESISRGVHPHGTSDKGTDDEAEFHSAEEDFAVDEPSSAPGATADRIKRPNDKEGGHDELGKGGGMGGSAKPEDGNSECASHGSNETESNDAKSHGRSAESVPHGGNRKSYWQRRREAKAKKTAEAKAAKPPRKAYVDDGLMKFRVTCYRNGPKHSFDSNDAAGHFGGLINDKFHWTVDLTRYDINVVLVIEGDAAYVTFALTKSSLHRRNIKHFGPTTLRATLSYCLLCLAEPVTGDIVMDPMCGGGSIPIEGALALPGTFHICGDVNGKCVAMTGDNITHNSKDKPLLVDALQWSVRRLPLRDRSVDVFVTDLPFGLRVGKQKDNTMLYLAVLTEVARVVRQCGRASLLTYDRTSMIRALQRTRHLWREVRVCMINQVLDLAFDSVGARVAAAEGNGHVQVWDARKASELLFCLSGHTCEVSKVCFSPGGGQLLTASSDGTARLWSAKDGRLLQILDGHSDEVFSCAFSYSGESILTASKDKTCRLWKRQPIIEE